MLTRIEIDGFKSFKDFALDVPPFLVVLGQNASGKSNLFDAIGFLSLLATRALPDAVDELRGDLGELLHRTTTGVSAPRMRFAVEVLLNDRVTDDFGDSVRVEHSRLRYELELEVRGGEDARLGRLFVAEEKATLIRPEDDGWAAEVMPDPAARAARLSYRRHDHGVLLETVHRPGDKPVFLRYPEGRERPVALSAATAIRTALSAHTTVQDFPLLFALQRELSSWRFLHLEPAALRAASSYTDPDHLSVSGANLPNTLQRLVKRTADRRRPDGILPDIASQLARIVPDVVDVMVDEDPVRRQRWVSIVTRLGTPHPADVASDGTLRALALIVALSDPEFAGLVCFEEPENGIYPAQLARFVVRLAELVERGLRSRDHGTPLVQLILTSYSPVILRALRGRWEGGLTNARSIVFFDLVSLVSRDGRSRITRARRLAPVDGREVPWDEQDPVLSPAEVSAFEVQEALD